MDFGFIRCKLFCTEEINLGVLYDCKKRNEASWESLVQPFFFITTMSFLLYPSSVFSGFLSFPFAFLPWELFGNEGDTGLENGEVVLSGSVPKSS